MKVKLNRQFLKSDLWGKIWDAVKKEGAVKKEVKLTTNLRTIHSSWILLPVAVAFTLITSPYLMMKLYGIWGSVGIIVAIIISAVVFGEKKLGKPIANFYLNEILTKETHTLNKRDVRFARISLVIIPVILIMDVASVASESYSWIYFLSVSLLVITTLLLALPIVKSHKNKK